MKKIIIVSKLEAGNRIDSLLAKKIPSYSRSHFADLSKRGLVNVCGEAVKPSYIAKENDEICFELEEKSESTKLIPQDIKLEILYEDNDVLVIDKQPGILVHPGTGNPDNTIANALVNYFPKIREAVVEKGNNISELRPGIVHRLDKDTSGVMIIAKNARAMHSLAKQIQNRDVEKTYLALCYSWPKEAEGRLTNSLGRHPQNRKLVADIGLEKGKQAISDYYVDKYFDYSGHKVSLIKFRILTGRTHQIRVQAKILGVPVIGDKVYNTKESIKVSQILGAKRQMLHAHKLSITLPSEKRQKEFVAPLPTDFAQLIAKLDQCFG